MFWFETTKRDIILGNETWLSDKIESTYTFSILLLDLIFIDVIDLRIPMEAYWLQ